MRTAGPLARWTSWSGRCWQIPREGRWWVAPGSSRSSGSGSPWPDVAIPRSSCRRRGRDRQVHGSSRSSPTVPNGNARLVVGTAWSWARTHRRSRPSRPWCARWSADLGAEHLAELAGPGSSDLAGLVPELGIAAPATPWAAAGCSRPWPPWSSGHASRAPAGARRRGPALVGLVAPATCCASCCAPSATAKVLYRAHLPQGRDAPQPPAAALARSRSTGCRTSHRISLEPLTDAAGRRPGPRDRRRAARADGARIRERSQGIPFFVEELTDCCDRDGHGRSRRRSGPDAHPPGRLSPQTREILRIASAAGTQVDHAVLLAVVDSDEQSLESALREAVERPGAGRRRQLARPMPSGTPSCVRRSTPTCSPGSTRGCTPGTPQALEKLGTSRAGG